MAKPSRYDDTGMDPLARSHTWSICTIVAAGTALTASMVGAPPAITLTLGALTLFSAGLTWRATALASNPSLDPRTDAITALADELDESASGPEERTVAGASAQASLMRLAADTIARQRGRAWHESAGAGEFLDALAVPAIACDASGRIIASNRATGALTGAESSLNGRRVDDVFTKAELLDVISLARRGVARTARVRLPSPAGVRLLDVLASPLAPGSPAPVALTMVDVTELAGAVQLKTDFVANASHELRTPIAAIRAAAETLEAAGDDEAMRHRLTTMIVSHVSRLDDLVRDMLDLSKLESPDAPVRPRTFDFAETEAELAQLLGEAAGTHGVELRFETASEYSSMRTDPRILFLILKNLVENAIIHARSETEVVVRAEVQASEPGSALISVIDQGAGIPLAQQQRVFERFFQVDEARSGMQQRGTGLGLAIVKHGVRALDGNVEVQSVWGQGTTMTVTLPSVFPVGEDDGGSDPSSVANPPSPAV